MKFSNIELFLLVMITVFGILCSVFFHIPFIVGFLPGLSYLIMKALQKGVPIHQLKAVGLRGILKTKEVMWILILVGLILPTWSLSETIPQMISLSLSVISVNHFLLLSFLLSAILSLILGTSVGTLSALGIPLISAAAALQMPLEFVAGALVSGAFIGDRTSPLSSSHQLLSHTIEVPVFKQIKKMLPTTIAAFFLSILFYSILDSNMQIKTTGLSFQEQHLDFSMLDLTPPLLLIMLVMFRVKIRFAFIYSIVLGVTIALFKGVTLLEWLHSAWFGIEGVGGGLESMILLILFIGMAGIYNGIIEEYQLIQPVIDGWMGDSHSMFTNTWKTILATIMITVIACNQTLPIILTGRSFYQHWREKINHEELARVMGDSSMLFAGMIPWSMLAIMCSTILGIPVLAYLPFALFLWVLPLLTLMYSIWKETRIIKIKTLKSNV